MAEVSTYDVALSYALESAPGVLPANPVWYSLEPNNIGDIGAVIETVARNPIQSDRQRSKGTITDLNASMNVDVDTTLSSFEDFLQGFLFATGQRIVCNDLRFTDITSDVLDGITTMFSAPQRAILVAGALLRIQGGGLDGIFDIATSAAQGDDSLALNGNPPDVTADLVASAVGFRVPAATSINWDWNNTTKRVTMTVANTFAAQGLQAGQWVHVGSPDNTTGAIRNALTNTSANDMFGWARVVSVSDAAVVFDKVDPALQFDDSATSTAVDFLFGSFYRNVSRRAVNFLRQYYQFELENPNLSNTTQGESEFDYIFGCLANTLTFNVPVTDKSTMSYGFVAQDAIAGVVLADRRSVAGAYVDPLYTTALNTSSDVARLRIADVDDSGLTTDFTALSLALNNNVTPTKVIGFLGSKFQNVGLFEVNIDSTLVFTNSDVVKRIRSNASVTFDFILQNEDGAIAIDVPTMTLGGGGRTFNVDEPVTISVTGQAHGDNVLNSSIGVSTLRVNLPE